VETVCLVFLSLVAAVFLLNYAQAILMPFILALLLFYALDPIVSWFCRFGIPRIVGCLLLIGLVLGTCTASIYLLRDEAADILRRVPEAVRKVQTTIEARRNRSPGPIAKVQEAAGELQKAASEAAGNTPPQGVTRVQVEEPLFRVTNYLWSGSVSVAAFIGQAITVVLLVFFLLAAGDLYKRKFVEVVGPRLSQKRLTVQILNEIDEQIGRFLLVQILTSVLIGTALGMALWLLGLKQAAMWGVLAGVLSSIPYFGAIIVIAALTLVAFLQFGTWAMVAIVISVTLFITTIDGLLLKPILASRFSKINPLAVFLGLLFWGWLWGALGMLLAVPIMVAIKSVCDHIEGLQSFGHLMGENK